MALSKNDIALLSQKRLSGGHREALETVLHQYRETSLLSDNERAMVESMLRRSVADSPVAVMRVISENLKETAHVPHMVARAVATHHSPLVAMPMLENSPALQDDDLLEIIKKCKAPNLLVAIARRPNLSETVVTALLRKKEEPVLVALLKNNANAISEANYMAILGAGKINKKIAVAMIEKGQLSLGITQDLFARLNDKDRKALNEEYAVNFQNRKEAGALADGRRQTHDQLLSQLSESVSKNQ